MNWDHVSGNWPELRHRAKEHWNRLTEHDLDAIDGEYESLVGTVQRRYGVSRGEAELQVGDWLEFVAITHRV